MLLKKRNKDIAINKKAELGKHIILDIGCGGKMVIGRCYLGDYVKLHTAGGILKIGNNVTILAGTTIGKNSVIGANSVVKGHYDDYCVIAGNPARVVKRYDGREWVKVK